MQAQLQTQSHSINPAVTSGNESEVEHVPLCISDSETSATRESGAGTPTFEVEVKDRMFQLSPRLYHALLLHLKF